MDDMRKRAREIVSALSEGEKLGMLSTHQNANSRLSEFYIGTEVARGYVGREREKVSTVFPQPVGLAATFDKELMEQLGVIAGDEARAYYNQGDKGGLCLWGPTVDMVRDPRWGRTEEAYGEDVCLTGELSAAYTRGMAGEQEGYYKTIPTLKHFCANNNEQDRGSCDAYLPIRLKYEYYYAAFENAVRNGGARSVMAAYNEINALPAIMNPELKSILHDQWGLWFVVSDGGDFTANLIDHHYCPSLSEAYGLCLKAGCEIMTDFEDIVAHSAESALEQGYVTWEEIDGALENVVYARLRLGQGGEGSPFDGIGMDVVECEKHREKNRRAAREQVVMLKNNGLLPLKKPAKIAVLGALCDCCLMDWYTGYSSYEVTAAEGIRRAFPYGSVITDELWDKVRIKAPKGGFLTAQEDGSVKVTEELSGEAAGAQQFWLQDWGEGWMNLKSVKYGRYVRLFDDGTIRLHKEQIYDWFTRETFNFKPYGDKLVIEEFLDHRRLICREDGELTVSRQKHISPDCLWEAETLSLGRDRAVQAAESADVVIYCVGNHPVQVAKECYDRRTLALNIQPGMTQLIAQTNPHTLLALISSYPYSICRESETAAAVLWSSHAGPELGTALGEVISGRYDPAGRLPLTWYRSELDLPDIMDYDIENAGSTYMYFRGEPLYPFGYGLSNARFEYSSLSVEQTDTGALARVRVKNVSDTDGSEVVQLYFSVPGSAVSRPVKKLCAFERAEIRAGETRELTLEIPRHILEIYDLHSGAWLLEEGEYRFFAGGSSQDERLTVLTRLAGGRLSPRPDRFDAETFDRGESVRLRWMRGEGKCAVYACGWSGRVCYTGIDLKGKTRIRLRASSVMGSRKLEMRLGETRLSAELTVSETYDDFREYTAQIPRECAGDLSVELGGEILLLDIAFE